MRDYKKMLEKAKQHLDSIPDDVFEKQYLEIQEKCKGDGSPTCEEFIEHLQSKVFGILDRFHPSINGDKTPEVRSDHPCFENRGEFMDWCEHHNAEKSEIYVIN